MTASPSPPNKRSRWIIVAVAVLVLGLGWWLWPRMDQRFVGRWQSVDRQGVTFNLQLNGRWQLLKEADGRTLNSGLWWTKRGWLILNSPRVGIGTRLWADARFTYSLYSRSPLPDEYRQYGVDEITDTSMKLRPLRGPARVNSYIRAAD
jgi:hypothetical protein